MSIWILVIDINLSCSWVSLLRILQWIIRLLSCLFLICPFSYLFNQFFYWTTAVFDVFQNLLRWWSWFLSIGLIFNLLLLLLLLLSSFSLFFDMFNHLLQSSLTSLACLLLFMNYLSFLIVLVHIVFNLFLLITLHHLVLRCSITFVKSTIYGFYIFVLILPLVKRFRRSSLLRGLPTGTVVRPGKESVNVDDVLKESPLAFSVCLQFGSRVCFYFSHHGLLLRSTKSCLLTNTFLYLLL